MQEHERSAPLRSGVRTICAVSPVPTVDHPSSAADSRSVSASLKIVTESAGDRTVVVVSGEIDIDSEQTVRRALRLALARSPGGLDLDLAGVGFCDCAGLNVLLSVRAIALADGKTLRVRAAGAGVERLFAITGTSSLFGHAPGPAATDGVAGSWHGQSPTTHDPMEENGVSDEAEELRVEVVQLKRAMLTRPVIDLARGVLMASFGLSREDAWSVLVDVSQRTNTKLHQLAEELVDSVNGAPLPEQLQQRISTAVAEISRPA